MNAKLTPARPQAATAAAAAMAALIGIGLVASVTGLFGRAGTPLEQLRLAEQACINHAYHSEREACMRSYFAAAHLQMASR